MILIEFSIQTFVLAMPNVKSDHTSGLTISWSS